MKDDVALLKLLEPAALDQSSAINAICLPTEGRSLPVGSVCLAAGWGKIGKFLTFYTNFLLISLLAQCLCVVNL